MKTEKSDISLLKAFPQSLVLHIHEFHHDPEANQTFANWLEKSKDISRNDVVDIPSDVKSCCYGS
ncbi:unnamed protein product [Hymenolepis diminuta]|uniref:Uncharacterized protein n=1 Tax=Hymenolepis diminuta TaxID=6216 RepID=A0A564YWS1_HYMDI|nr:unnamed protein product [Hymenolepis diminuta]